MDRESFLVMIEMYEGWVFLSCCDMFEGVVTSG
jgi:hypothetical protein